MKTEYTKGSWMLLWGNFTHFCTINKDTKTRIATIEIGDLNDKNSGCAPINEATANAILMSMSPEMFEYVQRQAVNGDKEAKQLVKKYESTLKSRKF
jgi:hypothetical protein